MSVFICLQFANKISLVHCCHCDLQEDTQRNISLNITYWFVGSYLEMFLLIILPAANVFFFLKLIQLFLIIYLLLAMEFDFAFSCAKAAKCPLDIYSHRLSCSTKGVSWLFLGEGI